jgi:uncharacterized protein YigE (DUF2233 family)
MKTLILLLLSLFSLGSPSADSTVEKHYKTTTWQDRDYAYEKIIVTNPNTLTLIPNYADHLTASDIFLGHSCLAGVNGGFYAENSNPLGLVSIDKVVLQSEHSNSLFNGFLSIGPTNRIANNYANDARIILQSGPLLIKNSSPISLSIVNDKPARRTVVAKNSQTLVFLVIFNPKTEVLGPYLSELPDVVKTISDQERLDIQDALNLDGGRASTFYSQDLSLPELDPVGSVFCVK